MSLKIVTGGTTGAADGTLVSSGNHFAFTAVDTVVNLHMRCDDDTYSADQAFSMPSDGGVQISFDGGSTWKAAADSPAAYGSDVGDLNVAIQLRQHASTATTSGQITTDGTFVSASALADVTGFTVTPGASQNALSWSAVTNRTAYRIDRATNSGFTTGVTLDITPGATGTSFTDTGLTNGITYYYRIKAVGVGRFKDSASYATGNGVPTNLIRDDLFTDTDGVALGSHTPNGSVGGGSWVSPKNTPAGAGGDLRVKSNQVISTVTSGGPAASTVESWLSGSSNADCAAEIDAVLKTTSSGNNAVMVACRNDHSAAFASRSQYRVDLADDGSLRLGKMVSGSFTSLGTYAAGALTVGNTYTIRVEAIGTAIKAYLNGTLRISVTDSSVTAGGGLACFCVSQTANTAASAATGFAADAVRLYNT